MSRSTCETCNAFNALANECRRHAPNAVPMPQSNAMGQVVGLASAGIYPATTKDGWCLEHVVIPIAVLQ